jgi:hypothetical protein
MSEIVIVDGMRLAVEMTARLCGCSAMLPSPKRICSRLSSRLTRESSIWLQVNESRIAKRRQAV